MFYQKNDVDDITKILGNRFTFLKSESDLDIFYTYYSVYNMEIKIIYSIGGTIDYFIDKVECIPVDDLIEETRHLSYFLNKKKSKIISEFQKLRTSRELPN